VEDIKPETEASDETELGKFNSVVLSLNYPAEPEAETEPGNLVVLSLNLMVLSLNRDSPKLDYNPLTWAMPSDLNSIKLGYIL